MTDKKSDDQEQEGYQKKESRPAAQAEEPSADQEQETIVEASVGKLEFPDRAELERQLTALEMKLDEYKNQAFRAQAEVENMRRRAERDVSNAHKYGIERLVTDLLPVIDCLIRGLHATGSQGEQLRSLREGMQMTLDMLEKVLKKHGLVIIEPQKGEGFNPDRHEAMAMQPHPDIKPNTIIEVLQKGYELNGRVLRAAMVVVAQ